MSGRLSRSADFDRVFREGRSYATRHLVLHAFPRAPGTAGEDAGRVDPRPRLGVSVGRRVGGAVERNRVRRRLKAACYSVLPEAPARAVIIRALPAAASTDWDELRAEVESAVLARS